MNIRKHLLKYPVGVLAACLMILGYMFYEHFSTMAEDNEKAWSRQSRIHPPGPAHLETPLVTTPGASGDPVKIESETAGDGRSIVERSGFYGPGLHLVGTMVSPDRRLAVIKDGIKGKQKFYQAGDRIRDAIIQNIFPQMVTLKSGDRFFALYLKMDNAGDGRVNMPGSNATGDGKHAPLTPGQLREKYPMDGDLEQIIQLRNQIRLLPNLIDGKESGVRVEGLPENSVFREMSLKVDDVILAIDDKEIETMDDAQEIFETIKNSHPGRFTVQRAGETRNISFNAYESYKSYQSRASHPSYTKEP